MRERSATILGLLARLIEPGNRSQVADELAACLGVESLIIFIADPEIGLLLPAPGFPRTLPNGRAWQAFLNAAGETRVRRGSVSWPDALQQKPAVLISAGRDAAMVLIGGQPQEEEAHDIAIYLPLVAGALRGERAVELGAAESRFAAQLAQQARELAQNLDRARRAGHEEIVARKRAEAEARELNATLERRVHERTESLRLAVAQMEEFSYSVSHDLRSPLRAIQGYAQVLVQDFAERLGPDGLKHVQKILTAGGRLDRLTQDVLTYTRVTREEIKLVNVNLDSLVPALVEEYGMSNGQARIELKQPLGIVCGHEALLAQCLSNLISNALKFVAPQVRPLVRIWTEANHASTRILVSDNGIGIRTEDQSRIFQLFERLDPARPGTGLGLAILRKAAERMRGSVGLNSAPGEGSTFWVQLQQCGT